MNNQEIEGLLIFINKNQQLIDDGKFDELFDLAAFLLNPNQCRSLQEIINEEGVNPIRSMTKIPMNYFYKSQLPYIGLPDNIENIDPLAFNYAQLQELIITNPQISIQPDAFKNCSKLKTVYFNGTGEDWVASDLAPLIIYDPTQKVTVICLIDKEEFEYPQKGRVR